MQIRIPELPWSPYGLLVVLSLLAGFFVAVLLMRRFKVEKRAIFYTCLLTFVCTFTISLTVTFRITENGLQAAFSGLGAVVGMIIGVFLSTLIIKDKPDIVMASFVACAPLMYGLAKSGCLTAGCCHGKEYEGFMAVVYHGTESYFPAQLIDMSAFILAHIISLILLFKLKNKMTAIYLMLAMLVPVRFVLEYLRYYHDGSLIASGQITVLIAGAIAVILITVWKFILKINYH